MGVERMCAFTDGVIAIIITIMVLDLRVPQGSDWPALRAAAPVFLAYLLSYINVGLFWNNHHHMLQTVDRLNGRSLWANLALLFWLSLLPFVIRWMGEAGLTKLPTAAYGLVLAGAAVGYALLQRALIGCNGGPESALARAVGRDIKGKLSVALYVVSVPLAFAAPWAAAALYLVVAAIWLVPDRRIERRAGPA
jgi:uncharacterized membrane protein